MEPISIIALTTVALLAMKKSGRKSNYVLSEDWEKEIRKLSNKIEEHNVLVGLGDFLIPCAWIESRGNPNAGSSGKNNYARGWFGMRPESAFNWRNNMTKLATSSPNLLKDPRWAVAMAADYTYRLVKYNTPKGMIVTFKDIRRGWKYPYMTNRNEVSQSEIQHNLSQFKEGIEHTHKDFGISDEIVSIDNWPGIEKVLQWVGAK